MKKVLMAVLVVVLLFVVVSCGSKNQIKYEDFLFEKNGKTCELIKYDSTKNEKVVIPRKVDGFLVTSIGNTNGNLDSIFKGHTEIKSIELPSTIHYIGKNSFSGTSISEIIIPNNVTYIGEDAFKDCKELKEIKCASKGQYLNFGWDKNWNSENIKVSWDIKLKGDVISLVASSIASGFISGCASKIGTIAINQLFSLFGYQDPETVFKNETLTSLDEIKKAIIDGTTKLGEEVSQINDKVTELRDFVTSMEREIFAKVDRTEFDTRMTVINQYIATLDTIYDKYQSALTLTDYDVLKNTIAQIITEIENANLPTMIKYFQTEFASGAAGSQLPIVSLYFTYLKNVYPFMHQVSPKLDNFKDYCEMEILKASQLYSEYCNYKQATYLGDDANQTVWKNNCDNALKDLNDTLALIEKLIPEGDFTLTTDNINYHIVNLDNDINFWFSLEYLKDEDYKYKEDDEDNPEAPSYYYADDSKVGTVTQEEYKRLDQLRVSFNKDLSLLDFINLHTSANVTAHIWGCKSVLIRKWYCCPAIDIRRVNEDREEDCTDGTPTVHTWK